MRIISSFIFLLLFTPCLATGDTLDKFRVGFHPLFNSLVVRLTNIFDNKINAIKIGDNLTSTILGFNSLCDKNSTNKIGILIAEREINEYEKSLCAKNDVTLTTYKIGYFSMVFIQNLANQELSLSTADLARAISKYNSAGELNTIKMWSEISSNIKDRVISIYGPRNAFYDFLSEDIVLPYCFSEKKATQVPVTACAELRTDGVYVENGEDYEVILNKNIKEKTSIGIIPYFIYKLNSKYLQTVKIDGVEPTEENIKALKYVFSWPIYIYINNNFINLNIVKEFIEKINNTQIAGKNGYLVEHGLIPIYDNTDSNKNANS